MSFIGTVVSFRKSFKTSRLRLSRYMAIYMAFLRLLLSSGLIFVTTAVFIEENVKDEPFAVTPCFSDYVVPVNHDVELTLFVEKSSNGHCYAPFHLEAQQNDNNFALYGKSTVVVNITRPMRHIKLRLRQPQINGLIFVMNNKQKYQNGKIQKYSYDYDTQSYDLYFQSELLEGLYTIETDFVGGLNDIVGLSVVSYSTSERERWIVAINDFQKIAAQLIFPCLDRLELTLNLTITMRHYIYNLVSNMKETKYTSENGIKSWQYHITSMTRNYLVFIVLKDFISVTHMEHKDIQIWYRKDLQWHMDHMWDIIYDVFNYLKNKWHIECSFPTMHIIIPNIGDGMMSPGLIFYREIDVMHCEESDHEANQMRVKSLITQKLIYQCLSNTSSWLIDGLVTLIEVDIIDKFFEGSRMLDLFVVQNQQESLHFDYHFNGKAIGEAGSRSEIDLVSSFPYYNKAPFILRMFRYLITDEIFREGVRKYVSRQAFHSTATSNNFWTAMEDALDENLEPEYIYEHNINLRDTMIDWMKQEHYPVVSLIRDYHFGWVSVWLETYVQSGMQELGIPLTFTSQTYPNFNRTSLDDVKWLKYKGITDWPRLSGFSMNREENGWIIANLQQSGYYRVNYDSENWNRITTYLNSEEYTKIHVLNRAQIIDDSFHLAIQEQQNFSLFWNLTRYLSRETDYIAWYPMFKALEYMSNIFPFQNRIVDDIKISLYKILGDLLARIGYHRQFNENIFTEYLRQEATKWACTLNYQDCLEEANKKLQQYFIHPERNILFPWWKEWTYCEGLKLTDRYTWWSLVHTLLEKDSYIQKTNKTLEMLACPQDLNIIKEYLKLITFNIKNPNLLKIEQFENIHIFHSIVAKHSNDFGILERIFSNFFGIKPSKVSTIAALIDIINHVYSAEQLKKVSQLIDRISLIEEESNVEGSLSSYIEYKINLRSSQIEKQATFLQLLKPAEDVIYIRR